MEQRSLGGVTILSRGRSTLRVLVCECVFEFEFEFEFVTKETGKTPTSLFSIASALGVQPLLAPSPNSPLPLHLPLLHDMKNTHRHRYARFSDREFSNLSSPLSLWFFFFLSSLLPLSLSLLPLLFLLLTGPSPGGKVLIVETLPWPPDLKFRARKGDWRQTTPCWPFLLRIPPPSLPSFPFLPTFFPPRTCRGTGTCERTSTSAPSRGRVGGIAGRDAGEDVHFHHRGASLLCPVDPFGCFEARSGMFGRRRAEGEGQHRSRCSRLRALPERVAKRPGHHEQSRCLSILPRAKRRSNRRPEQGHLASAFFPRTPRCTRLLSLFGRQVPRIAQAPRTSASFGHISPCLHQHHCTSGSEGGVTKGGPFLRVLAA